MTPLLCVLASSPGLGCRSSTHVEKPRAAMARAAASPVTPAPTTATSMCSTPMSSARHGTSWYNPRRFPEEELSKRALITGITGQDGSYLAELLLEKGY